MTPYPGQDTPVIFNTQYLTAHIPQIFLYHVPHFLHYKHCRRIVCNCVSNSGALLTYNTVHSPYISLFLRISEKRTRISAGTHVLLRKVL